MKAKANLYIIGAGNFARELESWIHLIPDESRDWELKGFLYNNINDNNPLKTKPTDYQIIGNWEEFHFNAEDRCVIGVADVEWRETIYNYLKSKVWFMPLIATNTFIGKFNNIPDGTLIAPFCTIQTNVKMGVGCMFNIGTCIGHDSEIGNFCSFMGGTTIAGNCLIGEKVYTGINVGIIPEIQIADKVLIGAGSTVIKNVTKTGCTVFGNPAREIPK